MIDIRKGCFKISISYIERDKELYAISDRFTGLMYKEGKIDLLFEFIKKMFYFLVKYLEDKK